MAAAADQESLRSPARTLVAECLHVVPLCPYTEQGDPGEALDTPERETAGAFVVATAVTAVSTATTTAAAAPAPDGGNKARTRGDIPPKAHYNAAEAAPLLQVNGLSSKFGGPAYRFPESTGSPPYKIDKGGALARP